MTLPTAECHLQDHLGREYVNDHWAQAFKAVMDAEGNVSAALHSLNQLKKKTQEAVAKFHPLIIKLPAHTKPRQLENIKKELLESVTVLQERRRIIGDAPTLDDLIELPEEKVVEDSPHRFKGGGSRNCCRG